MLQLERQQKILDYLKENRKATTNELSELLGVSTTTIRTDLNQMDWKEALACFFAHWDGENGMK